LPDKCDGGNVAISSRRLLPDVITGRCGPLHRELRMSRYCVREPKVDSV